MTDDNSQPQDEVLVNNGDAAKIGTIQDSAYGKMKYISIAKEMEKSYLDYAMSVIVSRALPDVRDGLKPVHRRILYSMYKSGIHHNSAYKKSARIVGDVLGKYHPHGDAPVYGALVRLAQDFNMRYPLIDGQGNFGSVDGDSPAAMRYTEARMAKISQELLQDLNKNTVKFLDNFDSSLQEPHVLPAKLPNLLLMGAEGIAVGMATKIPPHNLSEVCQAINDMIKNGQAEIDDETKQKIAGSTLIDVYIKEDPRRLAGDFQTEITFDQIMEHIQGPDFPTGGIIYDFKAIQEAYQTGKGKVVIRGKASIQESKSGSFQIIVTEIPYQVNKARLLIQIADLVKKGKIEGIRDLNDDSDRTGMQITIELKKSARPKVVLNKLFKYSQLQTSFPVNMVALSSEGTPQLMNIKQILREYVIHRQLMIVRRSQYDLAQARDRAHILEGLLIALKNLDEVIATIRKSADTEKAKDALIKKFDFTEVQALAILDMQLKRLAALERQKIEDEYKEIKQSIDKLIILLSDPKKILGVVVTETEELIAMYSDKRRTKLVKGKVGEFNEEDLVANEASVITLTESGYIKRMNPSALRSQSRGGKGSKGLNMKEEDLVKSIIFTKTHDNLLMFTNQGRVFEIKSFQVPESSRQAKGTAIVNLLNLKPEENVHSILVIDLQKDKDKYITLATKNGLVKKSAVGLYENIRLSGIIAITLNKDDEVVRGQLTTGENHILLTTKQGKSIRFLEKEVKDSNRDTKGVKGITLKKGDYVIGMEVFFEEKEKGTDKTFDKQLLVVTENGMGKRTKLSAYPVQKRSGMGVKVADVTKKTGNIASVRLVQPTHKQLVIGTKLGQTIKMPITKKSIPILTRPTQGVILMRLKKEDRVVAVTLTEEVEEE
ncbi:DNA gyrase subunit A [Patescibacteria group bacterium]|nr:DNA gyrase subunit A [Patescibacteria group bacterium]MBU1967048.1 DNA gyrase subunit A [Patescibacteria group bacterium]MBU2543003.1 DNA gyrase subunit A [Patescibacteria group bacterium]